ncbi:hypothetical protein FZC78_10820 [Rossellomorea vietnamensis]|uniref:Uncharacterized protein n=1 Tax=Rossellomorea vietnamensis TaxID=218284 RepID=A0A5D4NT25_9BACI|nr:hypothetical protein [Rossellomorea vietnamensis]TYS17100.1 hypothetical protein FZC78_10820 [Rossellomorea vietnamensis]
METLFIGIITTVFLLCIAFIVTFIYQFKNTKKLKEKVNSLEKKIKVSKDLVHEYDINFQELENKILFGSDPDLTEYVKIIYWESTENSFQKSFDKFPMLDLKVIEYGLIRMKTLEDSNDLSKFLPPVIVLILAFIASYNDFFKQTFFNDILFLQVGFPLVILLVVYLFLTKTIGDTRRSRAAVIYFNGLLQYAKDKNDKE